MWLIEVAVVALLITMAVALVVRFERFCLQDLAATDDEHVRHLTRQGWAAVILFSIPLGGIAYLSAGKWQ